MAAILAHVHTHDSASGGVAFILNSNGVMLNSLDSASEGVALNSLINAVKVINFAGESSAAPTGAGAQAWSDG